MGSRAPCQDHDDSLAPYPPLPVPMMSAGSGGLGSEWTSSTWCAMCASRRGPKATLTRGKHTQRGLGVASTPREG